MAPGVGSGALLCAVAVRCLSFAAAVCPSLRASASFPLLCMQTYCIRKRDVSCHAVRSVMLQKATEDTMTQL